MSAILIGYFKEQDGYRGTIEYDPETNITSGHILDIDEDIHYSGFNILSAYNDYLIKLATYVFQKEYRSNKNGMHIYYQQEPISSDKIDICPRCKGAGLNHLGKPCMKCYGTGHFNEYDHRRNR